MSRKSIPVILTPAEVIRLEQWTRAGSTPQQVVLRALIILAASALRQDREIAAQLKVHRRPVALWRSRVRHQGIGCVWEIAPGRGRKKGRGSRHGRSHDKNQAERGGAGSATPPGESVND